MCATLIDETGDYPRFSSGAAPAPAPVTRATPTALAKAVRLALRTAAVLPDRLRILLHLVVWHQHRLAELPNVLRPVTFNEKVQARKLFDRRTILAVWADKYAVRHYVAERSDAGTLPALYSVCDDAETIPFDSLPASFVLKATHGCGWLRIVREGDPRDPEELKAICRKWLASNYFNVNFEWVYKNITPRIIVEELLDDGTGRVPYDYKFYVFGGRVRVIQVDVDRLGSHRRKFYDTDWVEMAFTLAVERHDGHVERPRRLDRMIRFAEELSGDVDFVRVDLYVTGDGRIVFGELTTTSGNGLNIFQPREYDKVFGQWWNQPSWLALAFQRRDLRPAARLPR